MPLDADVPGVQMRGEPPATHVPHGVCAHGVDFVVVLVEESNAETGHGGRGTQRTDREVTGTCFGVRDRRDAETRGGRQLSLGEVSHPPDPAERATDVERLHGGIFSLDRGPTDVPEHLVDSLTVYTPGRP